MKDVLNPLSPAVNPAASASSEVPVAMGASSSRAQQPQPHPQTPWKKGHLAVLVPCALLGLWLLWFFNISIFPSTPLPICPECSSSSPLRETLEALGPLWVSDPQTVDELAAEMAMVETAHENLRASKYRMGRQESECLLTLIDRLDVRLNDYTRSTIVGLVGFGPDEACPKLQLLLDLSDRLQNLMNHTSKETPKCKELLDWHSQQYSCSPRQR